MTKKKRVVTSHVYWLGGWVDRMYLCTVGTYSVRMIIKRANHSGQTQKITISCLFKKKQQHHVWNTLAGHGRRISKPVLEVITHCGTHVKMSSQVSDDCLAHLEWYLFHSLLFGGGYLVTWAKCQVRHSYARAWILTCAIFLSSLTSIPYRCLCRII